MGGKSEGEIMSEEYRKKRCFGCYGRSELDPEFCVAQGEDWKDVKMCDLRDNVEPQWKKAYRENLYIARMQEKERQKRAGIKVKATVYVRKKKVK